MSASNTQLVAWYHFKFEVPRDWEVTSHSEEDRTGRLEFSTRYGPQGLVAWEPCKRVPDREVTMLTFLQTRVPGIDPKDIQSPRDLEIRTIGDFTVGYHTDETPCQALAYLQEPQKLLRWIFEPAPREVLDRVWTPILRSFKPNRGDWSEICMFGLHYNMPVNYKLEIMKVSAANVHIGYEHKRRARIAVRRLGLPEYMMNGQAIEEFYPAFLNKQKHIVTDSEPACVSGMAACRATYKQRGEHQLDKYMGTYWEGGQAVMWHNTEEKRLYAIEQIGPPKAEYLAFEEVFPGLKLER